MAGKANNEIPTCRFSDNNSGDFVARVGIRACAEEQALATSGPYAYTRNPLYLGSLIIAVGFAIAARSWWIAAAMVVFFVAIYMPVIRGEEKYLRSRFPEFEKYEKKCRVCCLV